MNIEELSKLRQVDEEQFLRRYQKAATAVWNAKHGESDNRWAGAAEQLCGLLGFVVNGELLWEGLHEAIDVIEGSQGEINEVRIRLGQFVDDEYELLTRRGLDQDTVARIVFDVQNALNSLDQPTHEELGLTRDALGELRSELCNVSDWSIFALREREARDVNNATAILGSTGCALGAVSNTLAVLFLPLLAGSVAGGVMGAIAALRAFRKRKQ